MPAAAVVLVHEIDSVKMEALAQENALKAMKTKMKTATQIVSTSYSRQTLSLKLACDERATLAGCVAEATYLFKACKDMNRKKVNPVNGFIPHGTICGSVQCSKSFFGFPWKTKTTKTVCECNEGECAWSKPLHKCPLGLFSDSIADVLVLETNL